jgi:hypothetical protein
MTQKCHLCKPETARDAGYVTFLKSDKKRILPTYLCEIHAWEVGAGNSLVNCRFPEKLAEEVQS